MAQSKSTEETQSGSDGCASQGSESKHYIARFSPLTGPRAVGNGRSVLE